MTIFWGGVMNAGCLKRTVLLVSLSGMILGCAAKQLNPAAAKVRVLNAPPDSKCQYLGQVIGSQGNFFTGAYTLDANLQQGALNDLRNQAAVLGGNVVVLLTDKVGLTEGSERNVTTVGNVYQCPL